MKRRILFVAEALTLAQVVRLLELARGVDRERYDVHFACRDFPELLFGDTDFESGLNFIVGVHRNDGLFLEMKATAYGVAVVRLLVGYDF